MKTSKNFRAGHWKIQDLTGQASLELSKVCVFLGQIVNNDSQNLSAHRATNFDFFFLSLGMFAGHVDGTKDAAAALRRLMESEGYQQDVKLDWSPALAASCEGMAASGLVPRHSIMSALAAYRGGTFHAVLDQCRIDLENIAQMTRSLQEKALLLADLANIGGRAGLMWEEFAQNGQYNLLVELTRLNMAWSNFFQFSTASGLLLVEANYLAYGHGSLVPETQMA